MNRIDPKILFFKPPGATPTPRKSQRVGAPEAKSGQVARVRPEPGDYRSLRPESRSIKRQSFTPLSKNGPTSRPVSGSRETERNRLEEASRDFEAVFMRYLTSAMRKTIPKGGTSGIKGAHFYQGMIDEQLGRMLADSGRGLRLAQTLSRIQPSTKEDDRG